MVVVSIEASAAATSMISLVGRPRCQHLSIVIIIIMTEAVYVRVIQPESHIGLQSWSNILSRLHHRL